MILDWLRKRSLKTVTVATLSLATVGILLFGAGDVSAAAVRRGPARKIACIRQFVAGSHARSALDALVQNGTLTQSQEDAVVTALANQMTGTGTCTGIGLMRDHAVGNAVSTLLGMDRSEIKKDWANGQSLTEIAQSKGVSRDKLISTIEQAVDAKLQAAVASGKITAERKTEITSKLDDLIGKAVDLHKGELRSKAGATPATPMPQGTPAATSANAATV